MQLHPHIHNLLLENDCVSIPGFGGLVAQRFRAEINHGTHLFRPPSKRISYHKDLVANSHLLLNKLVNEEKISQAKASEVIAATVAMWKASLANGDSIKLNSIGRFYLDKEGQTCFNQSLESNFDLDAFGLDIFRATAIKRDVEIKEAVTTAIVENYKKTNKQFPFWRAAAVFTGIGALLTIGFFKSDVTIPQNVMATLNPWSNQTVETPAIEPNQNVDAADETSVHFEEVKVETPKATPATIEPKPEQQPELLAPNIERDLNTFEVVVGSFKEVANAQELANTLKNSGYNPTIIKDNTAFTKVSIEGFGSRLEAVQAMRAYKLSVNKSAWIYTSK